MHLPAFHCKIYILPVALVTSELSADQEYSIMDDIAPEDHQAAVITTKFRGTVSGLYNVIHSTFNI